MTNTRIADRIKLAQAMPSATETRDAPDPAASPPAAKPPMKPLAGIVAAVRACVAVPLLACAAAVFFIPMALAIVLAGLALVTGIAIVLVGCVAGVVLGFPGFVVAPGNIKDSLGD